MAGGRDGGRAPFSRALDLWNFQPGAYDDLTGREITEPRELEHARIVDTLARRYSALPSVVRREPISTLRMLRILELGGILDDAPPE